MMSSVPNNGENKVTDEALIKMLLNDDEQALKEIFSRYHKRLFGLANAVLQDSDLSKDLVQDVFVDLWNRRHTSHIQQLSGYLSRAIKFQVLKQLRDKKLHDHHLQMVQKVAFINQTEEAINFNEVEQALKISINQLPLRCREVFMMSRFEYLSNKEIAERLQISPKTVEIHITKALSYLRTCLGNTIFLLLMFLLA